MLCVTLLGPGNAQESGCENVNQTISACESILADVSGDINKDCESNVITNYTKCLSTIGQCANISDIAATSIARAYPGINGHQRKIVIIHCTGGMI